MTHAFRLVAKALSLQVPPRALIWGLMNKINYVFRTGNRRFEFERLYLESPDPWNYRSSTYERDKYERILECVLQWRSASESVLEIGCSVGVNLMFQMAATPSCKLVFVRKPHLS